MRSNKPQVVIVRKDKRVSHKVLHAAAFAATGGLSGFVTAAEVTSHAGYNARTRKLQAGSSTPRGRKRKPLDPTQFNPAANFRADHVPSSREYRETHR